MKILFSLSHGGGLRNYESTVRLLAERGHSIHLQMAREDRLGGIRIAHRLAAELPGITYAVSPRSEDVLTDLAVRVRGLVDYLRFLHPKYKDAGALRERAARQVPAVLRFFLAAVPFLGRPLILNAAVAVLLELDKAIPTDPHVLAVVDEVKPDLVMITPLVEIGSSQVDYVKAARKRKVRSFLCVHSWDNLTNKGLIRLVPDGVAVWNEAQKKEAVEFHAVPPARVAVTGAPCYDQWFERKPSSAREAFCRRAGLDPARPYILYLCSSPFIAPEETAFVSKWIEGLRARSSPLKDAGVLIRPHPQNGAQWGVFDASKRGNVAVWPRGGENPVDDASRANYYDSIHHAAAVMGLNTSAMIETGIIGRPVHTILAEEFRGSQEGTLHFHHLVQGGLLRAARDLDENMRQLEESLSGKDAERETRRRFVRDFVRPRGLDVRATPLLADAVESVRPAGYGTGPFLFLWGVLFKALFYGGYPLIWLGLRCASLGRRSTVLGKRLFAKALLLRELRRMARGSKPIIVGPWISEVGFELLYWIPFLNWFVEAHGVDRRRLVVVSRGGAESWYGKLAGEYRDVFDYFAPAEYKDLNIERIRGTGGQKHVGVCGLDLRIAEQVKQSIGTGDVHWLHPRYMYELFRFHWRAERSVKLIQDHTRFRPFKVQPRRRPELSLPEKYVAVKFYHSEAFPETAENKAFAREIIRRLAARRKVVSLDTGLDLDEHRGAGAEGSSNIVSVGGLMTPRNNLDLQTEIIAGADLFVGTYGGFSYLAPFCGVPSVGFYSREDKILPVHLDVAHRAYRAIRFGNFDKVGVAAPDPALKGRAEFLALPVCSGDLLEALFSEEARVPGAAA